MENGHCFAMLKRYIISFNKIYFMRLPYSFMPQPLSSPPKVAPTVANYRPVSTQENIAPDWIGLDFFPSCIIRTAEPKNPGCGSQVQTGTENWYRKPMRGFQFCSEQVRSMLIFLSGNRVYCKRRIQNVNYYFLR